MKSKIKTIVANMDSLFKLLDAAKLAPESILKSDAQKEHYESLVMFAYRKFQAAQYHRERVTVLSKARQDETDESLSGTMLPDKNTSTMKMKVARTANEFTYELCAFFAALRSSIDFVMRACILHSKAVQADSISHFITWIEKGKTGPTLDVVAKHIKWLKALRDYRDYLVHRLVIGTVSGGQREWKDGVWHSTPYPIVVPSETPKHIPDTRRARAMAEPDALFDVRSSHATVTYSDGSKKVIESKVEISAGQGYLKIEELMDRELIAFETFFGDVLTVLTKLNFQEAAIVNA
jgi:hypothetical protein